MPVRQGARRFHARAGGLKLSQVFDVFANVLLQDPSSLGAKDGDCKVSLSTAQIGKCGELLVQYRLLLFGVESAPMSTDTGIDLVAYSSIKAQPVTIQVKTNLKPKPGGGKGKLALDWWVPEKTPAAFVALADLSTEKVWLFTPRELQNHAQQQSSGRLHIYMYTDPTVHSRNVANLVHVHEFEHFLLSNVAESVFGTQPGAPADVPAAASRRQERG